MKNVLIGLFAHPDDEAFGPAGTLLKLKSEGYDIHLILLTDGEAGTNLDNEPDLGSVRLQEWQTAADILGATSTHALHYPDGGLKQVSPEELDESVSKTIASSLEGYSEPIELSFMTLEPHGLTGHHDHIAASHLATRMAKQVGARDIWYFCLDKSQAPLENTAYYEPRAREDDYITTRIDVSAQLTDKYRMMDAHHSQRQDATSMKKLGGETEHFHVETSL